MDPRTKYLETRNDAYRGQSRNRQGAERNILARLARGTCMDCGLAFTRDNIHHSSWDHRESAMKTYNIGHMNKMIQSKFDEEIAKCDLVCLHCHATRTKQAIQDGRLKVGRGHKRSPPKDKDGIRE